MGQFDLVPAVLASSAPGSFSTRSGNARASPCGSGRARGKPIFALSRESISTLVCATRYIVPALRAAAGLAEAPPELVTRRALGGVGGAHVLSARAANVVESGATLAAPRPTNTSGDFVALAGRMFVELAAKRGEHPAGTVVRLFRW